MTGFLIYFRQEKKFFIWKLTSYYDPISSLYSKLSGSNVSGRASEARSKRSKERGVGRETRERPPFLRPFCSPGQKDLRQANRPFPRDSGDRLPNWARTLGTRFLGKYSLAIDFLIEPGYLVPGSSWARTLGTRFLGTYPLAIDFLIEPGHLGPGSSWARTLGTRFLGMYPVAIYFLSEPGHLGAGS